MIVRKIRDEEYLECSRISSMSFHWSLDIHDKTPEEYVKASRENPKYKGASQDADIWAAFTDEGEMMACLSVLPYKVYFDGHQVPMAGIGSVCTYPQHRRKGAVREMFRKFLNELYEKKVPFSYLYPFSEQFYGKFGYYRSCLSSLWEFDLKTVPSIAIPGTFHLHRPGEAIDAFKTAYQAFASKWNMMVDRDHLDWNTVRDADPFKGEVSAFLYRNQNGTPAGYFVFEKRVGEKGRRYLGLKEMAFDSFETLKALMAFAKTFSSDYEGISFVMPASLNLDHFCTDYSQSESARQIRMNGMARAVDVMEVLRLARYKGSGQLSIYLHDDFLLQNNGLYSVAYDNSKATEIKFASLPSSPFGETGEFTADVEMTVNVFSSAILGNYGIKDFEYMDGIRIYGNRENAEKVFFSKPCWINNYF